MMQAACPVACIKEVANGIFVLRFIAAPIASSVRAGQFVNIRAAAGYEPLLRRPFSVYWTEDPAVEVLFNIVGRGTSLLRHKHAGDTIDVLGPLGVPFSLDAADFDTGIMIGGGLGVAPIPVIAAGLKKRGKECLAFLGARTANGLVTDHLDEVRIATDDGTAGTRGTVVDLVRSELSRTMPSRPRIFACGPTPMLRAVAALARELGIPCEVSLEGPMACGIGICQGCPVELAGSERQYALMCKDGPVFDIRRLTL